ncbi:hypothetical protein K469DRAFT_139297 [Zopfia rhizophila CBS 207.26]|uniref:Uncharacterized protein n=1 Tax=Zopfia rhizophila CBS 207.26 TaxID=1314779 RepID=A0A6A6E8K4_9PEZI|nr:hypothetical protein K469DRAFT_139297 [Zopfia rhizophila CBS 207.26]
MVEDGAALGRQQDTHKFLSKHRWRGKIFSNDEALAKEAKQKFKLDDDVNDFLKPSTERAQEQKELAAAAFLASKPKIDVAKAQRWPGASDIIASAEAKSSGVGGLKSGKRKKGLTVSFARTTPEIIGEGGDESEEPSIAVSQRKKSNSLSDVDKLQLQTHRDDMHVGTRSPKFSGLFGQGQKKPENSVNREAERKGIVKRSITSAGEMSPPLKQKMEMGSINTHASPPPPPPRGLGQMGLSARPKPLQRAPTGFDMVDDGIPRPSLDSTHSYDSDNSPVVSMKAPSLAPTLEEEDEFVPKPLQRSATGWSEHMGDSDDDATPPPLPTKQLLDLNLKDDDSPLDSFTTKSFLESEPSDPNSFSARIMHKMRAEEGRALQEAAKHATEEDSKRDSGSSSNSFQPAIQPSNPFEVGTPPQSYNVASAASYGRTPPRLPSHEPPPAPQNLDADNPRRSHARRPSPARPPMPPGTFPLDTDPRPPSSSSSQYTVPSAASKTRGSPIGRTDPLSAVTNTSIQQTPSSLEKTPFSALTNDWIQTTQSQYEKQAYFSPEPSQERAPPPPPPPHAQDPGKQVAPNHRQDPGMQVASNHQQDPGMQVVPSSLARSDTRAQGDAAFLDFAERVQHMQGIFRLTAELGGQMYDHSPMQWLRVATWWFLRGRAGMESMIRSRPKGGDPPPERLTQPHVDLAKTWWILSEVVQNHPGLRRYGDGRMETQARSAKEAGDPAMAEVYEAHDVIIKFMKLLMGSMRRHQVMPPTQALIQGQDQTIWIQYPNFAPDVQAVLSGKASKSLISDGLGHQHVNPATSIPLGDTKADFCYFRMFVNVSLSTEDVETDRITMPAVLSVLRPRDELSVKLAICSMSELINVFVQSNKDAGPTWRDVRWKVKSRKMHISLRRGYDLNIEFNEQDFRSLWAIVDHTNRVESSLREREDERLAFDLTLRDFSYKDPTNPQAFPAERVRGCKVMVFEKAERSSEGTGKRRLHRGYRLLVVTNTKNRTLSYVNHELGKHEPMIFEYLTDADNAPAFLLRIKEEMVPEKKPKVCTMYFVFNESKERNHLFGTLTSMNVNPDETVFAQVPLKAFNIESADPAEGFSQTGKDVLKKLQWQEGKVLNQDPEAAGLESAPMVMSESLRIVCRHSAGCVTDRMNLNPGEILVRLPINGAAELTILRNPQQDMALAVDAGRTDKDVPEALAELLRTLTSASTLRTLTFHSFRDLHTFQLAVTGFSVKFDGIASTFSISRRRMVVPIYKQWTANTIRLQVVAQDNIIQLLAFFEEFSHADAMNFQLKSMDVFEKIEKGGKPCVRLVDAKFALPVEERRGEGKMGKEEGRITGWSGLKRRFICLDMIEYPGEHDDILIGFDNVESELFLPQCPNYVLT